MKTTTSMRKPGEGLSVRTLSSTTGRSMTRKSGRFMGFRNAMLYFDYLILVKLKEMKVAENLR